MYYRKRRTSRLLLPLLLVLSGGGPHWRPGSDSGDGPRYNNCGVGLAHARALHDRAAEESSGAHSEEKTGPVGRKMRGDGGSAPAEAQEDEPWRLFPPTARGPPPRKRSYITRLLGGDDDAANNNGDDDQVNNGDDDENADNNGDNNDDLLNFVNEKCSEYLIDFLEGTTDAKDNCDGIMNAYTSAKCASIRGETPSGYEGQADDDHDDYFGEFYEKECCQSLRQHYYEYCDEPDMLTENNLILVAGILLITEFAKSFVKKNNIHILPEAGSCILVGTVIGLLAHLVFGANIDLISFDEDIFMCILLPPIIFEAALTVNKKEFRRRRGAIFIFAIFGTLFSTFTTGLMVHFASWLSGSATVPMLDSLVFGALISSIDPVAILSVLTGLGMSETDTIFILVFGESLLNDGIAITLFKSLKEHYSNGDRTTVDEVFGSVADFLILLFGSALVAIICGVLCIVYFWLNKNLVHPVMEVATFFLWALIPYWVCEYIEWSGIVSIVVMGFFMDVYLSPKHDKEQLADMEGRTSMSHSELSMTESEMYHPPELGERRRSRGSTVSSLGGSPRLIGERLSSLDENGNVKSPSRGLSRQPSVRVINMREVLMRKQQVQLSPEANEHVRFVAHILAQLAENAIFAYLGLFLFSSKYNWDALLCSIAIASCILSRALMVVLTCWVIWHLHIMRQRSCTSDASGEVVTQPKSKSARALANPRTQAVLVLAGLRGAVSLALVENIPIYNGVTGQGSQLKPEMKAMTSAAILFTMFIFGGGAYYILGWMGVKSDGTVEEKGSNPTAEEEDSHHHDKRSSLNPVTEMYALEPIGPTPTGSYSNESDRQDEGGLDAARQHSLLT